MSAADHNYEFRGFGAVAGRNYRANASWFGCSCLVTRESIAILVLGYKHVHEKAAILELRWNWLPLPTATVISRIGDQFCHSTFQAVRWSKLRHALDACGYKLTQEDRYCPWRRSHEEIRKYDLCTL